jgi:hypothetical protein
MVRAHLTKLFRSRTLLLLPLFVLGFEDPGLGQILPPCCGPPAIISDLTSRAGTTDTELRRFVEARSAERTPEMIEADIAAVEGACTTGCAPHFATALSALREVRARFEDRDIEGPPCCEVPKATPRRAIPRATPAPASDTRPQTERLNEPQFRSRIVQGLLSWRGPLDEVPEWLRLQLRSVPSGAVQRLQEAIAGSCAGGRTCPPSLLTGRLTLEGLLAERSLAATTAEARETRDEDLRVQEAGRWATLQSGLLGGVLGALGALLSVLLTNRRGREQSHALCDALRTLELTLSHLQDMSRSRNEQVGIRRKSLGWRYARRPVT